jgi:hypothetical protein
MDLSLLSCVSKNQYVDVLYLGFSLLSSVSKHNMWWYYGWFCLRFHQSVNTICDHNRLDLSLLSCVSKNQYVDVLYWVSRCCLPSVSTTCGRIMVGFVVVVVCQ